MIRRLPIRSVRHRFAWAWFLGCVLALPAAAQDVVYASPARPPGWEAQLWPANPVTAPADFAKKQREQWGDDRLDAGALRSSDGQWQVLTGAGWIPYDAVSHTGIVRMYYRYGLHTYRGQVHQEPEGNYQALSRAFPQEFPPLPWIFERPPQSATERPLEDIGMIRSLRDSVAREWRLRFSPVGDGGGGGSTSANGLISARPMALAVTADVTADGAVAFPLEIFNTSRTWAVEAQRTGLPASVTFSVAPRRGTGPAITEVTLSWPAGLPVGVYDRARVQLSVGGGVENKLYIPLVFTVRETAPEPEPIPEPEPTPEPAPAECPPPPVCRCEAEISRRAPGEPVGATVLCIPVQSPPR